MASAHVVYSPVVAVVPVVVSPEVSLPSLHRITEVRRQQGVSLRSASNACGVSAPKLRAQEVDTTDLKISDLHKWQEALDVPVSELLEEPGLGLSQAIQERAQMVKLMKTAAAMLEAADAPAIKGLAKEIVDELVDFMPELKEVGPWHSVGQRRGANEFGRVMEQPISLMGIFGNDD
jgi:transcriptional regulator with XRE-family HTH domain